MRVALTGHTSGLGKAIFDHYYPDAIGFSRSNGYDIRDPDSRASIIYESKDADVFINNAHSGFAQVDLLYGMHDSWRGTSKLIINISSNSGDGIKNHLHVYAVEKSALDKASEQLSRLSDACRIFNLRPGYMDTPRVANIKDQTKLAICDVVSIIDMVIGLPTSTNVVSLTVLPR